MGRYKVGLTEFIVRNRQDHLDDSRFLDDVEILILKDGKYSTMKSMYTEVQMLNMLCEIEQQYNVILPQPLLDDVIYRVTHLWHRR